MLREGSLLGKRNLHLKVSTESQKTLTLQAPNTQNGQTNLKKFVGNSCLLATIV